MHLILVIVSNSPNVKAVCDWLGYVYITHVFYFSYTVVYEMEAANIVVFVRSIGLFVIYRRLRFIFFFLSVNLHQLLLKFFLLILFLNPRFCHCRIVKRRPCLRNLRGPLHASVGHVWGIEVNLRLIKWLLGAHRYLWLGAWNFVMTVHSGCLGNINHPTATHVGTHHGTTVSLPLKSWRERWFIIWPQASYFFSPIFLNFCLIIICSF